MTVNFVNGIKDSLGSFTLSNGSNYIGKFKDGKKHGEGQFTWGPHNSVYQGNYEHDKIHGDGTMLWMPDQTKYWGQWD